MDLNYDVIVQIQGGHADVLVFDHAALFKMLLCQSLNQFPMCPA